MCVHTFELLSTFGLIWMVVAPAALAMSVSDAAGWTIDDVPQTKKTWDA
jgi:hypothetical protein